jgi:hypothetical protein
MLLTSYLEEQNTSSTLHDEKYATFESFGFNSPFKVFLFTDATTLIFDQKKDGQIIQYIKFQNPGI